MPLNQRLVKLGLCVACDGAGESGWEGIMVLRTSNHFGRCFLAFLVPGTMILIGACATPYKAAKHREGYSEYRITDNTFALTFRANIATREEMVDKYLLRRASELTLEHGFKYFVISEERGRTRSSSIGYSGVKFPVVAPGSTIRIRCYLDPPADVEEVIDASYFLQENFPEVLTELNFAKEPST